MLLVVQDTSVSPPHVSTRINTNNTQLQPQPTNRTEEMARHSWVKTLSPPWQTFLLCTTLSLGYCTTYLFTRPLFVLPQVYMNVTSSPGSSIDRQTSLALAQSLGYLFSKWPAVAFMSSSTFFRHRQACLCGLYGITATFVGVGFGVFDQSPIMQSVSVGISSLFTGMIYGGMVSYAEGRGSTEIVVASLNLSLVLAGGIARFFGTWLVNIGISWRWVPAVASSVGLLIGLLLLDLLAALPSPTAVDQRDRGVRRSMTGAERMAFIKRYLPGLFLSIVAYMSVMTIRSFRDYFALQLYTEANGGVEPSPSLYFWADVPGSVTVCFSLGLLSNVKSNRRTLMWMITAMIVGILILGGGTVMYDHQVWSGIAWQVSCGVGIYTAYLVMGTAFLDRLLAASHSEGTIVFLQFISDGSGWFGTVGILFWKSLYAPKDMPVSELFSSICFWSSIILCGSLSLMMLYFMTMLPIEHYDRDEALVSMLNEENDNDDDLSLNGGGHAASIIELSSSDEDTHHLFRDGPMVNDLKD